MSGIYIPGMELPKGYPICIIIDAVGQARRYDLNNDRYADDELLEAVPVPDHGRLIDADALSLKGFALSALRIEKEPDGRLKGWRELVSFDNAPTIIPADKEDE